MASRVIALASWAVLLAAAVIVVPQLAALLINALGGAAWTPPINAPGFVDVALSVAGIGAGLERTLRLRADSFL